MEDSLSKKITDINHRNLHRVPGLIVELRKVCVDDCGHDKSITYKIDGPHAMRHLERSTVVAKRGFRTHKHKTKIVRRVTKVTKVRSFIS